MMYDFGFIGTGNMGSALAKAVAKKSSSVLLCNRTPQKAEALAKEIGVEFGAIQDVAKNCKYIFLAVKPQMLGEMFEEIKGELAKRQDKFILVSMAAGTSIGKITALVGFDVPVIRIMPNVACAVGAGMTLCAKNDMVSQEDYNFFADAMSESGALDEIEEEKIDNYSIVTGCGPAYLYVMIEALANGQEAIGVPREKAYLYAAQMAEGSAKLMLASGRRPDDLKDSVCSPGGTTIEGVKVLEGGSFKADVIEAVSASYKRTLELLKK